MIVVGIFSYVFTYVKIDIREMVGEYEIGRTDGNL